MVEAVERDRELGERLTAGIADARDRIDMLEPAARGVLGRPQMLEDRRHVREGHGEVGPAGDAHQAHGAPIDEDRKQRQEILDLGPLEQAAQKQDWHAEPFEVLPDRRQLLIAGAKDRLVPVGVARRGEAPQWHRPGPLAVARRAAPCATRAFDRWPSRSARDRSPRLRRCIVIAKPEKLATISGTER